MIYLKKFNESNNEFYTEISEIEWRHTCVKTLSDGSRQRMTVRFPQSDVDYLTKFLEEKKKEKKIISFWTRPYGHSWVDLFTCNILGGEYLLIELLEDEWYIVRFNSAPRDIFYRVDKFFKCDQLEGLIKLLDDIL